MFATRRADASPQSFVLLLFASCLIPSEGGHKAGGGRRVTPVLLQARHLTGDNDTLHISGEYARRLSISLGVVVLDLHLNTRLLPADHALHERRKNSQHTHKNTPESLCEYGGGVRGARGSWAGVSLCRGVRGVYYDGHHLYHVHPLAEPEPGATEWGEHVVHAHRDLTNENHTCGHRQDGLRQENYGVHRQQYDSEHRQVHNRVRRSARAGPPPPLLPYNSNARSRYVQLALVADHGVFRARNGSVASVHSYMKQLANIVNQMYTPLNIFVVLQEVEVWTEGDRFELSEDGDQTLTQFLRYRREHMLPARYNDNAMLVTSQQFTNQVVGKALKGMMCTYQYSGGVVSDHSAVVGLVASTVLTSTVSHASYSTSDS